MELYFHLTVIVLWKVFLIPTVRGRGHNGCARGSGRAQGSRGDRSHYDGKASLTQKSVSYQRPVNIILKETKIDC